ncbi:MAG TPA: metallophosphoesterase family protein [Elusimicrobiota bacterium]|nr:metallophosphoesterase family protein [Elusimicrobiota bacterium]
MSNLNPGTIEAGAFKSVALIGGIYSNYLALEKALELIEGQADTVVALGDFGAFGPHPDRTLEILRERKIPAIRGNYEEALADGADDCRCGYTDPRDNEFAQLSYDYTRAKTSRQHVAWMAQLPAHIRLSVAGRRVLLSHGSPRRVNEFLWKSATPEPFIRKMLDDYETDVVVCTHTGLHWSRLVAPGRGVVNAGALGRPANDGTPRVWVTLIKDKNGELDVRYLPVHYDFERLAKEMESEKLPPEFIQTVRTGWWTTCLEILPAKERAAGKL